MEKLEAIDNLRRLYEILEEMEDVQTLHTQGQVELRALTETGPPWFVALLTGARAYPCHPASHGFGFRKRTRSGRERNPRWMAFSIRSMPGSRIEMSL